MHIQEYAPLVEVLATRLVLVVEELVILDKIVDEHVKVVMELEWEEILIVDLVAERAILDKTIGELVRVVAEVEEMFVDRVEDEEDLIKLCDNMNP